MLQSFSKVNVELKEKGMFDFDTDVLGIFKETAKEAPQATIIGVIAVVAIWAIKELTD